MSNNLITIKNVLLLSFIVMSLMLIPQVYADNSMQPNAVASYNYTTNQVMVSWDFDSLPTDARCVIKGDFNFNNNINTNSNSRVGFFIPTYYSVTNNYPILFEESSNSNTPHYVEEISCTGSMRIDIDSILDHKTNTDNLLGFDTYITFYTLNDQGEVDLSQHMIVDELYIGYDLINNVNQSTINYGCGIFPYGNPNVGNNLYIDGSGSAFVTNADNCKRTNLTSNQWINYSMDDPNTTQDESGIKTQGYHIGSETLLYKVLTDALPYEAVLEYDPPTHTVTINYGFDANSHRNDCYFKTEMILYQSDINSTKFSFVGLDLYPTNNTNLLNDLTSYPDALVPCQSGNISYELSDYFDSDDFVSFEIFHTFISETYKTNDFSLHRFNYNTLNVLGLYYSEKINLTAYDCPDDKISSYSWSDHYYDITNFYSNYYDKNNPGVCNVENFTHLGIYNFTFNPPMTEEEQHAELIKRINDAIKKIFK